MASFDPGAFFTDAFSVDSFLFPSSTPEATPILFAEELAVVFSSSDDDSVRVDASFDVDSAIAALTIDD